MKATLLTLQIVGQLLYGGMASEDLDDYDTEFWRGWITAINAAAVDILLHFDDRIDEALLNGDDVEAVEEERELALICMIDEPARLDARRLAALGDSQPRSDGPIGLSSSKILSISANLPNRR